VEEQPADELARRAQARRARPPASTTRAPSSTRTPPNVNVIPHAIRKPVNGGRSTASAQFDFGG
jgi:hypothetical protein